MSHNYHKAWACFSRPEKRGGPKGAPYPMNATIRATRKHSIEIFEEGMGIDWKTAKKRGFTCARVELNW